ncbi:MAG TPA: hypothetical protein VH144_00160 [Candidatus Saccharimonadales bacterium]|jgi:type II secretory pathway pseudopilin PulG|nr:hypothetical protein [Candidatus Saccharimonadales bacterium]
MTHAKRSQGFTIIELLFAMSFLTFMLLFIIGATIQVMRTYNKGIVTKQVNQSGRTIVEEMSRAIRGANPTDPNALNKISLSNGRLCLGGVSYIWNIDNPATGSNKYKDSTDPVLFARVKDPSGIYCGSASDLPAPPKSDATELISNTIWVQNVSVIQSPSDPQLVQLHIRLSTADPNQPTVIDNGQKICANDSQGDFCAVTDFTTVVAIRNIGT